MYVYMYIYIYDIYVCMYICIYLSLYISIYLLSCRFDIDELTKFTLTVRRNYRRVPYHNWTHAFSVAQCMYMILKKASSNFMLTEVKQRFDYYCTIYIFYILRILHDRVASGEIIFCTTSGILYIYYIDKHGI